ncbi:MAG TPA: adenylate/guanylate cyclase domain-containing protein [Stellaceae bacterium]|nr:adenylate/guanylate cyclase domain-containing protein [Stellaceae bacterium]
MPVRVQLRIVLWFTTITVVASSIFGHLEMRAAGGGPGSGYLRGALVGAIVCLAITFFEFLSNQRWGGWFRRQPFLALLLLRSLVYLAILLLGLTAGHFLLPTARDSGGFIRGSDLIFSAALAVGFNLLYSVNTLLGPGVLFNFAAGRYHQPRLEPRALLFIDLHSSTAIAERLGETRFLVLLNRYIADLTLAIAQEGGEIHKYVGDEIIATWRLARPGAAAAAIRACFAARARLAARGADYEREFGLRPEFRAGLHCGMVAIGELGVLKMEIALIGDTMNTAARIEQACRDTGHAVLASAALLERVGDLPTGIVARALGPVALRGKGEAVALYALAGAQG